MVVVVIKYSRTRLRRTRLKTYSRIRRTKLFFPKGQNVLNRTRLRRTRLKTYSRIRRTKLFFPKGQNVLNRTRLIRTRIRRTLILKKKYVLDCRT